MPRIGSGCAESGRILVQVAPDHRLALEILEGDERIDLLVTDVVMPSDRVNGLALSRMARLRRPDLAVMYVSDYDIPGFEDQALGTLLPQTRQRRSPPRGNREETFGLVAMSDEI